MKTEIAPASNPCPGWIDWNTCPGLWRNPKRMSGAWCFDRGRVTLSSLFQNILSGMTLDQYLLVFPMKHEHNVSGVLGHVSKQLQGKIGTARHTAGSEPGRRIGANAKVSSYRATERSTDGCSRERSGQWGTCSNTSPEEDAQWGTP